MKKIFQILIVLMVYTFQSNAQDLIIKRTGDQIKAIVSEINPNDVVYKAPNDKAGKLIKLLKIEIHKIVYSDGSEEVFNQINSGVKLKTDKVVASKSSPSTGTASKKNSGFDVPSAPVSQKATPSASKNTTTTSDNSSNGVFTAFGVNYVKQLVEGSPNQVGLQAIIGYRFAESVGIAAMIEPAYVIPPVSGSGVTAINVMAYPALIYKVTNGIHLYGGFGLYGVYLSAPGASAFESTTGYQGGVMINAGPVSLKAGYSNATDAGSKGSVTVGITTGLKW